MDTLSFILGIAFVAVIAIAVVAVYALVKGSKTEKHIENQRQHLSHEINHINRAMYESNRDAFQRIDEIERILSGRIDELERNVFSQMDSRFDKLENKLTNKK